MARRIARFLITILMIAVASLPLVLTLSLGWEGTDVLSEPLGPGSDIWVILVLVYAVWLPLCVAVLIAVYDRLGVHYQFVDRPPRETKREKRRRESAMSYLRVQESARSRPPRRGTPPDGGPPAGGRGPTAGASETPRDGEG
jgi:hypothetical protein